MIFRLVTLLLFSHPLMAELCQEWGAPIEIGALHKESIPEASGLIISALYPDRLYHINDSGDGPFLYLTNQKGEGIKKIEIEGASFTDTEDLSYGICPNQKECLFIADIGDNWERRKKINITILEETNFESPKASPVKRLTLTYPDKAHNAESFAIHPKSGDLYILTKEQGLVFKEASPAKLYKLNAIELWSNQKEHKLTFLYSIDVPSLVPVTEDIFSKLTTSMDFTSDGESLVVLTYQHAYEFLLSEANISNNIFKLIEGKTYKKIPLVRLPQQEALSLFKDSKSFIYTSEHRKGFSNRVPMMQVRCLK